MEDTNFKLTNFTNKLTNETSYIASDISAGFDLDGRKYLKDNYLKSNRKRHRLCYHKSPELDLHDIIIQYDKTSYIPPNKHIGKSESLVILEGTIEIFFFTDDGSCFGKSILSSYLTDYPFFCRIPANMWHGLRVLSDEPCIVKETIAGPYSKDSLAWASFAPKEDTISSNNESGFEYYKELSGTTKLLTATPILIEKSSVVSQSTSNIALFARKDLSYLKERACNSDLKRSRVCIHEDENSKVQEMFIFLAHGCEIPASYHLRKDESIVVLEGNAEYLFLDDRGITTKRIPLKPFRQLICEEDFNSHCFTRINRYICHQIVPSAEGILLHEVTSGPFRREDTDYVVTTN